MRELHLIAHDIRSCENVGALFRTADALGVHKIWLTGYTPAPPDPKIAKTALGAETSVAFEKHEDLEIVLKKLEEQGIVLVGLELGAKALNLATYAAPDKLALLLGTETTGIPPSLIERCDHLIQIPMKGIKESMNVTIAAAIASYAILNQTL